MQGLTLLVLLIAWDALGLRKFGQAGHAIDNVAHLGGYAVGAISGWWWRNVKGQQRKNE